jgi:hypothetical protein
MTDLHPRSPEQYGYPVDDANSRREEIAMIVMRTDLQPSPHRTLLEDAIEEAIGGRDGDERWRIDLHSYKKLHGLSLTITGPIGAWYKTFYEEDKVTIGRIKATVKDEIDRRLA